jgi:hypothetical protein
MPENNKFSSVKTFRQEMPDQPPVQPERTDHTNVARIVIAVLALALVILLGINFFSSPAASILNGKANVQGHVVDEHGLPVSARVIIFGTELETTTNQDGVFLLNGVPAGNQILVVAYKISAVEIPLSVMPGHDLDVGQIQFKVTAAP